MIYVDSNGQEWRGGINPAAGGSINSTPAASGSIDSTRQVFLPLLIEPMYPVDDDLYIYSHCCQCGQPINGSHGYLVLEFVTNAWGVRIGCGGCANIMGGTPHYICTPIVSILDIVTPVINAGCSKVYHGCTICERPGKCHDPKCREVAESGILGISPIDDLLEHFYRVKLDVVSVLIQHFPPGEMLNQHHCSHCDAPTDRICRKCRIAPYCNYGCKFKDKHECTSFVEIWRSAQLIFGAK